MDVGAVSLGWSGHTLEEVFAQIASMGGSCVEINGNTDRHHNLSLDDTTVPRVLAWADGNNLVVTCLSGYCDFAQTDVDALDGEIERLLDTCRVASKMDVRLVRAFTGDVKPALTLAEVRANIVAAFRVACNEAAQLGVTLGIENHGRLINDGPALAKLVDDVGAGNLGFTLDTGNFAWAGHGPDQVQKDFEACIPRVVNLHIKDGRWTDRGFVFATAGEGELPLRWLLEDLVDRGYDGPVCSEYEGTGDFVACTARSISFLKSVIGNQVV